METLSTLRAFSPGGARVVINNSVELAMIIEAACKNKSFAVDATCGNGHDTLRLSKSFEKVFAFDIQSEAIESTQKKLKQNGVENVSLINDSHSNIFKYLSSNDYIDLIMFNLGYLPGRDKSVHTNPLQVIEAVESSMRFMRKGSAVIIVMYPGFDAGLNERNFLIDFFTNYDQKHFSVSHTKFINQKGMPPELLILSKIRD